MIPFAMVVRHKLVHRAPKMTLAQRNDPIEAFFFDRSNETWRTFLANHVAGLVSIDFFTVPTLTGCVLFVFVVLMHHRRRIVHFNITEHPTAVVHEHHKHEQDAAG